MWFINFNLTSHELSLDTIGFSRMEFQFRPILLEKQSWRLKLKLHAAQAGWCPFVFTQSRQRVGPFLAKTKRPFAQGDCRKAQTASLGSMMQANLVAGN